VVDKIPVRAFRAAYIGLQNQESTARNEIIVTNPQCLYDRFLAVKVFKHI